MSHSKKTKSVVHLKEKHFVSLTKFKQKPYFHITNKFNQKSVSLSLADMQSLVDNFAIMKKRVERLSDQGDNSKQKETRKSKDKKKKKCDERSSSSDDDEESSEEEEEDE